MVILWCRMPSAGHHAAGATALAGVRYVPVDDLAGPVYWQALLVSIKVLIHTASRVHVMTD